MSATVGCVVIGRNEGERLIECIKSVRAALRAGIVYVDSASTDGSVDAAAQLGADVMRLDMSTAFTAARARNAGAAHLRARADIAFIQFIDGDCTLAPDWLSKATAFLEAHPEVAVACGRRRERRPEASIYNRLCDIEWDTPVGEALSCGGDALIRVTALFDDGGYRETLVAGEEPELCLRLRQRGWKIWRLDAEMTTHDAAIVRFSQWWKRSTRAGHAFAEISALHRRSEIGIWKREALRSLIWASIAPASLLLGAALSPWFLAALLAYPAQAYRLWRASRAKLGDDALPWALATVTGKFAEAQGALTYRLSSVMRRPAALIEYK